MNQIEKIQNENESKNLKLLKQEFNKYVSVLN